MFQTDAFIAFHKFPNLLLPRFVWDVLLASISIYLQKTMKLMRLIGEYVVFVLFSTEYMSKKDWPWSHSSLFMFYKASQHFLNPAFMMCLFDLKVQLMWNPPASS